MVVDGQTVSVGGGVVTLSGDQVASLGVEGLVVQIPGGGVTTLKVLPTSLMPGGSLSTSAVGGQRTGSQTVGSTNVGDGDAPTSTIMDSAGSSAVVDGARKGGGGRLERRNKYAWILGLGLGILSCVL